MHSLFLRKFLNPISSFMPHRSSFWICVVLIALSCGGENDATQNKVNDKQAIDDAKTKDAKDPSISENLLTEIIPKRIIGE